MDPQTLETLTTAAYGLALYVTEDPDTEPEALTPRDVRRSLLLAHTAIQYDRDQAGYEQRSSSEQDTHTRPYLESVAMRAMAEQRGRHGQPDAPGLRRLVRDEISRRPPEDHPDALDRRIREADRAHEATP